MYTNDQEINVVNQDKVGFCKPPKASQFKPGQSGNPKGRPKNSKNFDTYLGEELEKKIKVMANGKQIQITKGQASAIQLANAGVKGDYKALPYIKDYYRNLEIKESAKNINNDLITESEELIWQNAVKRMSSTLVPVEEKVKSHQNTDI